MASNYGERTRWMGDSYQHEYKKDPDGPVKKLALVQTPGFVGEFLLDRTLEPALTEFGLEGFKMVDPTCGTGHLLCQAFDRLWDKWTDYAPDMPKLDRARLVLASITGIDLDPLCVEIARLRLTIAACDAAGVLPYNPHAWGFTLRVVWADALLPGDDPFQPFLYRSEALSRYGEYVTPQMMKSGITAPNGDVTQR